jgi:hypothetical protein
MMMAWGRNRQLGGLCQRIGAWGAGNLASVIGWQFQGGERESEFVGDGEGILEVIILEHSYNSPDFILI